MPSWFESFRRWRKQRRRYLMLDPDKLRPGDIIFSTERAWESFLIRRFTRSPYSHAAIYLGNGLYAEAVDVGVRVRSITTIVKERLRVIRLKGGAQSQTVATAAAERVNRYLHLQYGTGSAVMSLLGSVPSATSNALFCSQLVAKAYDEAGLAVAPGLAPEKVTPGLLAKSRQFEDITDSATFSSPALPEHLVLDEFETLADREVKISQDMHRALTPFFESRAIPTPRDWLHMLRYLSDVDNPEAQRRLDGEMLKAMKDFGYVRQLHAARDEALTPLADWVARLDPASMPAAVVAGETFSLRHNLKAFAALREIDLDNQGFWHAEHVRTGLGTFLVLERYAESHANLRQQMVGQIEAALAKLAQAGR